MTFLLDSIISSNDSIYLSSLINDDIFLNYRRYIRRDITNTTMDYSSLSTKLAYDAFTNSTSITTNGNIQTTTIRNKQLMKYSKQYTVDNNIRIYSYRLLSVETPSVVTADGVNVTPTPISKSVDTEEQVISIHALKTVTKVNYIVNTKDDLMNVPNIFINNDMLIKPPPDATHYGIKVILLRYYSSWQMEDSYSMYGSFCTGVGILFFMISIWLLTSDIVQISTINKWIYQLSLTLNTFLPVILSIFIVQPTTTIEAINFLRRNRLLSSYQVLSGIVTGITTISLLIMIVVKS